MEQEGTLRFSGDSYFSGTWTRTNGTVSCGSSLLQLRSRLATGAGFTFVAGNGTVEY
jgi:hypothetical protein